MFSCSVGLILSASISSIFYIPFQIHDYFWLLPDSLFPDSTPHITDFLTSYLFHISCHSVYCPRNSNELLCQVFLKEFSGHFSVLVFLDLLEFSPREILFLFGFIFRFPLIFLAISFQLFCRIYFFWQSLKYWHVFGFHLMPCFLFILQIFVDESIYSHGFHTICMPISPKFVSLVQFSFIFRLIFPVLFECQLGYHRHLYLRFPKLNPSNSPPCLKTVPLFVYPLSINSTTVCPVIQEKKTWQSSQDFYLSLTCTSNQFLSLVVVAFGEEEPYY